MSSIAIAHQSPSSNTVAGVHTVSATAISLVVSPTPCRGVLIQRTGALNVVNWGDASAQPMILSAAGVEVYIPIDDASKVYIKGTAADTLAYVIFK
jgi:hypothetical protein